MINMTVTISLKSRRKKSEWLRLLTLCGLLLSVSFGCSSEFRRDPVELSEYLRQSKPAFIKTADILKAYSKPLIPDIANPSYPKNYPKPYQVFGQWYYPLPHSDGFRQRGLASWYGKEFHGRNTSNGEVFNMYEISAAHKILPLGTYVRVRNLENGKTLDLRVNDRGPFVSGRIIDLSKAAAIELGVYGPGTAKVEVIALGTPTQPTSQNGYQSYIPIDYYNGNFKIQVGAFRDRKNAEKMRLELNHRYKNAQVKPYYNYREGGLFYRVLVGSCSDLNQAEKYESSLKTKGFNDAFTVAD